MKLYVSFKTGSSFSPETETLPPLLRAAPGADLGHLSPTVAPQQADTAAPEQT